MDDTEIEQRLTGAIELVGHEARARTLVELAASQRESPDEPWVRFSDLRRRVGHDDPGNFNYHLKRLCEGLVEKGEAGYRLSDIGQKFVGVLLSARFDPDSGVDGQFEKGDSDSQSDGSDAAVPCLLCSTPTEPAVEEGTLLVRCEEGHTFAATVGPDVLAENTLEDALDLALLGSLADLRLSLAGVCPVCDGPMTGRLASTATSDLEAAASPAETAQRAESSTGLFVATCEQCALRVQSPIGVLVVDHPAVVALCYDHGLDHRTAPWEIVSEHVGSGRVVTEQPLQFAVDVSIGDDGITLVLDDSAAVEEVFGD